MIKIQISPSGDKFKKDDRSGVSKSVKPKPSSYQKGLSRQITKWVNETHQSLHNFAISESDSISQEKLNTILLQRQTEEHSDRRTIWYSIKKGEYAMLPKKIENLIEGLQSRGIEIIDYRDAVGSTIVHTAYLYNQYKIGRWMVQKFPSLALEPYSDEFPDWLVKAYPYLKEEDCALTMPYAGQNILHMVIMRRQLIETRWLLDFYRIRNHSFDKDPLLRLLKSKANGNFFQKDGLFYSGGYPLHFAVCTNDTDMFDLVLAYSAASVRVSLDTKHQLRESILKKQSKKSVHGRLTMLMKGNNEDEENDGSVGPNAIFLTDIFGNTALHLCVLHHLKEMYSHVMRLAEAMIKKQLKQKYATCKQLNLKHFVLTTLPPSKRHPNSYALGRLIKLPGADMTYDHWVQIETDKILQERLIYALNEDYHNPLSLIASTDYSKYPNNLREVLEIKKKEMISFLISQQKTVKWTYGPITCSVIPLEGLEISFLDWRYKEGDVVTKNSKGAIEWLCVTDSQACMLIPEIKKIVNSKWHRVGFPRFYQMFREHLFLTIGMTITIFYIDETPTFTPKKSSEVIITIIYPIVMAQILYNVYCETSIMLRLGVYKYFGLGDRTKGYQRGAAKFGKWTMSFIYITFLLGFIFKISIPVSEMNQFDPTTEDLILKRRFHIQDNPGLYHCISLCMFVCWISCFKYLMAFDQTGPFVLTISRIISIQTPFFLRFFVVMLFGFACALSMLVNNGDPSAFYGFANLGLMVVFLIESTVQQPYSLNFAGTANVPVNMQYMFDAILTLFFTFVVLMMSNLLISMINQAYKDLETFDDSLLLVEKYNLLCSLEMEASPSQLMQLRLGYTIPMDTEGNNLSVSNIPKIDSLPKMLSNLKNKQEAPKTVQKEEALVSYIFELEDVDLSWWDYDANGKDRALVHQKISLLIIDPQRDFHLGGSLAVPGADDDSLRIADMIRTNLSNIHEIFVTMDSHYRGHIAHSKMWQDINGNHPAPFTQIMYKDIWKEDTGNGVNGTWLPAFTRKNYITLPGEKWLPVAKSDREWWENYEWVLNYASKLETKGREKLTIWPVHCLVGSRGHSIVDVIHEALQEWTHYHSRQVIYVMKGQNCRTENYSALQADVEDPLDPTTSLNEEFLSMLKISDRLIICGQALSHCVKYTALDIMDQWHKDYNRITILEDGCSSVQGFEVISKDFLKHCAREGVQISTTDQVFKTIN